MREHLDRLNPEQRRAVLATEGPLLVLAGAGTGKTRVITTRIAHLLAKGVAAERILAVTFTNKAADEMRERVAGLVGAARAKGVTACTFHSFCARVLREHGEAIGIPRRFSICDASDQLAAAKSVLRDLSVPEARIRPHVLQARISLLKNRLVDHDRCLAEAGDDLDALVAHAYRRYDEHLKRTHVLDFDDLLLKTLELLDGDAATRRLLEERFRYILVDEYQDTNGPQYEIVRRLARRHRNLCVVGDDDQSIYGWRGADVSKILGFERDFPGALVVRLETNYRSTAAILDAANRVIRNNPGRHEKTLRSALGEGDPVKVVCVEDEEREAQGVVADICHRVQQGEARFRDCAILFRTQTQPRLFEAALRERSVPYVLVGGPSFFDRKEVRDVLAYLRLLGNPLDEVSLLRIVNRPPRGIGKTTVDRVMDKAAAERVAFAEAFDRAADVPASAREGWEGLRGTLKRLGGKDPGRGLPLRIRELIEAARYRDEVARCYEDPRERQTRWAAVDEVLALAESYVRRTPKPTLSGFLERLALSSGEEREPNEKRSRDAVTLMTLHAAKGLEFPRVYLVGMEEGILPHERSVVENGIDEERRLAYVGITRAKRTLTITHVQERARHGRRAPAMPSRFLFEMSGTTPPKDWRAAGTPAPPAARTAARRRPRATPAAPASAPPERKTASPPRLRLRNVQSADALPRAPGPPGGP
ncbi:MAG TPA: UvrD-helicase domain-containing protein [Planctomycetota bacterium]|nr:UvrD-helicase domain-containing protein [Planctomycetota bacterium]